MHLVIDGDQMIFACGFAAEGEPDSHAFHLINKKIDESLDKCGAKTYNVYIKGKGNFRDHVAVDYKATRTSRKPSNYEAIYQFLIDRHMAEPVDGMEADDKVSILLWEDFISNGGERVILSSPDKDLKNTPGWHYNPMKQELFWVSEKQANRHFLYQMLVGDRTDNIPGLPSVPASVKKEFSLKSLKVGAATAKKLMATTEGEEDALELVFRLYCEWGKSEESDFETVVNYFYEQANLLWMVRELDADGDPVFYSHIAQKCLQLDNDKMREIWNTLD